MAKNLQIFTYLVNGNVKGGTKTKTYICSTFSCCSLLPPIAYNKQIVYFWDIRLHNRFSKFFVN